MSKLKIVCAFFVSIILTACGGGGGGGSSSNTPQGPTAEGPYQGTTSNGYAFQALVLEDDQIWALYGSDTGGTFYVAGFIQGQGASNNGSFTSSNVKDFGVDPAAAGSLSATYVANASITGTVSYASGSSSFYGSAIPASEFDYSSPASLADITGSWVLTALDGTSVTVSIASSGSFTGSSSNGCNFSGTVAPRPSGKNVFNVSVTFGAAPCALPYGTGSGIGVTNLVNGGPTRQLIVLAVDSSRTYGDALFGTR